MVRAKAVNLVRVHGWSMRKSARHLGIAPSTVSRWIKRAPKCRVATIETRSSRPIHSPNAIDEGIRKRIIEIRLQRKRCPQVIHAQLKLEGIQVSFSSVYRTLKRNGLIQKRSPWKKFHLSGERPKAEKPGSLVETDTIHVALKGKKRSYIFTLIDCHSRWAFAKATKNISAGIALKFIREAQKRAPFDITCLQSDHGPEFSKHFTTFIEAKGTRHRHCRVRKPNDNAHVERFNRTIQDEMETDIQRFKTDIPRLNKSINQYLRYYNNERLHMGIEFKTPAQVLRRS